ncbi:MAG TPA: glycogen-binding domain-containing protein [Longimicrobiales bacterium]|nr:glycogen-binding domain-containing protein [Longimicrobiales bacterium]
MDQRTQKALDGELPREQLTAAGQADLLEAEARIRAVLRAIPAGPMPDLAPAVMRRIEDADAQRARSAAAGKAARPESPGPIKALRAFARWIWNPRPVSVAWRPVYGVATAALLAVALIVSRETAPVDPAAQQVLTQFVLEAPDAQQVVLAGDFTNWQPVHALTRTEPGVWSVVVPLAPGVHNYAFIVDGDRWVPDPNAPAVNDGFGGLNSRLAVLAPDAAGS